jgi:3-methyladenine DNA glycosylase/8-oxoguanine DNA glycosylase
MIILAYLVHRVAKQSSYRIEVASQSSSSASEVVELDHDAVDLEVESPRAGHRDRPRARGVAGTNFKAAASAVAASRSSIRAAWRAAARRSPGAPATRVSG